MSRNNRATNRGRRLITFECSKHCAVIIETVRHQMALDEQSGANVSRSSVIRYLIERGYEQHAKAESEERAAS